MIRRLAALSLLLAATAASAQPAQLTRAQRAHVAALGQALARCHGENVQRLAHAPLSVAQVAERVLAACAAREAPIRAEVARYYGPRLAPRALAAQHQHYREAIGQMVARVRGGGDPAAAPRAR